MRCLATPPLCYWPEIPDYGLKRPNARTFTHGQSLFLDTHLTWTCFDIAGQVYDYFDKVWDYYSFNVNGL